MTRNDKWSYTFQDAGRWSFAEISRKLSECEINVTPCTRRNSKKQFNNSSASSAASSATSSVANQDVSVVERKLKYGATLDKILSEEAKKFNLSLDEFLENPECSKRVEQLAKVFEVMNQKEFREFNTVLAGAPGLGKHKS